MNFTPSQVSEILSIPPSTLRLYASKFADYLSPQEGRQHRLYNQYDIKVLQDIRDLAASNVPYSEIPQRLQVVRDAFETSDTSETSEGRKPSDLSLIPEVVLDLEESKRLARSAIDQITILAQLVDEQTKTIERQRDAIDQLQKKVLHDWQTYRDSHFETLREIAELKKFRSGAASLGNLDAKLQDLNSRIDYLELPWIKRHFIK